MSESLDTRDIALNVLIEIDNSTSFTEDELQQKLKVYQFAEKKDRAFLTRLVEGVVERKITLDRVLMNFSKTPLDKMKPLVKGALRMGVYQLLFMDSVPDRAAISESVRLVKLHKMQGLAGFCNAVLRSIASTEGKAKVEEIMNSSMAVKYSTPKWLCDFLVQNYGEEKAEKILASQFENHATSIRVVLSEETGRDTDSSLLEERNTFVEELVGKMEEKSIRVEKGELAKNAYLISNYDFIKRVPGYRDGAFVVQDQSSQAAVEALGITKGARVIDLCAAPGGKTMYAAELTGTSGSVLSRDVSEDKTDLIDENIERLGLTNVTTEVADATALDEASVGAYDFVISDVPCSGLGVMGRKNDIKYHVKEKGMKDLAEKAYDILCNAVAYAKPNGRIMYSTCTINPGENMAVVEKYIAEHPGTIEIVESRQFLQGIDDCDGFFYTVLRKLK